MATQPAKKTSDPDVILDILCEDGKLVFSVWNKTDRPVYSVRIKFAKPVFGADDKDNLAKRALFNKLDFLAPDRDIRMVIDRVGPYFAKKRDTIIICTVSYKNADGQAFVSQIRHNLAIYKDLGDLPLPPPGTLVRR